MLPPFDPNDNLPPGIHSASWEEFVTRFRYTEHRRMLIAGLELALQSLRQANCRVVYMDGSFVTAKEVPNDYDGCWDIDDVNPELLDPVLLTFDAGRVAQKRKFLGELFPAQVREGGSGLAFLEFFQIDKRTGEPKGIVRLEL